MAMKFLIALALVASVSAFPRNLKVYPKRIVGGTDAGVGAVPHQISLQYYGSHICGGSILTDRSIITAAHCSDYSVSSYSIRAGLNNIENPEANFQERQISAVFVHPQYDDWTINNDIAIMHFEEPLVLDDSQEIRTRAVTLPASMSTATGEAVVTGWGSEREGGSLPDTLKTVTVPIITDAACRQAYGEDDIADSMICAGVQEGGKDSCQGDSGGPMVHRGTGNLIGIVSWGIGCARPGYPGVYTEVSHFIDWIDANKPKA